MSRQKKTPAEKAAEAQVGALIRRARQTLGWSTFQLAVELGVTNATISAAERGLTPWPKNSASEAVLLLIQGLVKNFRLIRPKGRLTPEKAEKVLALLVAEAQVQRVGMTVRSIEGNP